MQGHVGVAFELSSYARIVDEPQQIRLCLRRPPHARRFRLPRVSEGWYGRLPGTGMVAISGFSFPVFGVLSWSGIGFVPCGPFLEEGHVQSDLRQTRYGAVPSDSWESARSPW
jgi:hypothetical protein